MKKFLSLFGAFLLLCLFTVPCFAVNAVTPYQSYEGYILSEQWGVDDYYTVYCDRPSVGAYTFYAVFSVESSGSFGEVYYSEPFIFNGSESGSVTYTFYLPEADVEFFPDSSYVHLLLYQSYAEGLVAGESVDNGAKMSGFLASVVSAPYNFFSRLLNFEFLGVNMFAFFQGLLTLVLVVTIVLIILKFARG